MNTRAHYDAIVVGARVAGSTAAIALGRQGRRVLLLDKAAFPSDTISTHVILAGGAKVLERLGVMPMLEKLGGVRYRRMRAVGPGFDYSSDLESGSGDIRGLCLTRVKLDAAMVDAARDLATVTVRERFRVTDLVINGGAIVGVRGEDDSGTHEFHASLTIGADGMRGAVAKIAEQRLNAFARQDVPCARAYYYAYFDDVPFDRFGDELITDFASGHGPASLACRCDEGRVVAACAFDAREMREFRTDLSANLIRYLAESTAVSAILQGASRTGKVLSSGLLTNTYRVPAADGAILLGDAGLHVDPLFGQGHTFALMSAEIMAELAPRWFESAGGNAVAASAMAEFTERRDAALMPYYRASLTASSALEFDKVTLMAHRAASTEQWAADEMARFALAATPPPVAFPSFRLARLIARQARIYNFEAERRVKE